MRQVNDERMNEGDLSKLWYLANALVRAPDQWRLIFDAIQKSKMLAPSQSQSFVRATKALQEALESYPEPQINAHALRKVAANLLSSSQPASEAGRALAGALENVAEKLAV